MRFSLSRPGFPSTLQSRSLLNPNSTSTSSVCSPRSGVRITTLLGVRDSVHRAAAPPAACRDPASPCRLAMPICFTCGSANISSILIDRPGRDALLIQALDPVGAGVAGEHGSRYQHSSRRGFCTPQGVAGVIRILQEMLGTDRLAEARPGRRAGRRDIDLAVHGFVDAGRNAGRVSCCPPVPAPPCRSASAPPGNPA